MPNLGALFLYPLIRVFLDPAVSCTENSCGNIVHQQLLVDHIHNCWDDLLDIFLPVYQSHNIVYIALESVVWESPGNIIKGVYTCAELEKLLQILYPDR